RRHVGGQPVVPGLDRVAARTARLAVHVVALVGRDEVVGGYRAGCQVTRQRRQALVVGDAVGVGLRRRVARDVLEEDEGVVLWRVKAGAGDRAGAGGSVDALLVRHPGHAVGGVLDLRRQVAGAGGAVGA